MTDDTSIFEWGFKGLASVVLVAIGWLYTNPATDVKALNKSQTDFELDAEKRFAKEDHVNENLSKVTLAVNALQAAINTNTNMTSVIMEKISAINERLKQN